MLSDKNASQKNLFHGHKDGESASVCAALPYLMVLVGWNHDAIVSGGTEISFLSHERRRVAGRVVTETVDAERDSGNEKKHATKIADVRNIFRLAKAICFCRGEKAGLRKDKPASVWYPRTALVREGQNPRTWIRLILVVSALGSRMVRMPFFSEASDLSAMISTGRRMDRENGPQ